MPQYTRPRPEPQFDVGESVDAFGWHHVIVDRHWDEMWREWFYRFETEEGRTPESEISKPSHSTTFYIPT